MEIRRAPREGIHRRPDVIMDHLINERVYTTHCLCQELFFQDGIRSFLLGWCLRRNSETDESCGFASSK